MVDTFNYTRYQASRLEKPVETRIVLRVGGLAYNEWKSINISRSIAQIAGSFSFTTHNKYAGKAEKWGFTTGDTCTVEVDGQKVISGYIDEIEEGYSSGSHDITFSGRDKTGDLVDCHYDVFSLASEFNNLSFLQIIQKLTESVGIDVLLDDALLSDSSLFKIIEPGKYIVQTFRPIYEDIAAFCQQHGVLPITNGDGNLLITRAGTTRAHDQLQSGVNIKENKKTQSDKDRFSIYYAEGQTGPATAYDKTAKLIPEGIIRDEAITRFRPFLIPVGEQATDDLCQKRAAWEARIRMGSSRKVDTVVRRWTQSNNAIWPLNGLVSMLDDKISINDELLIAGIELSLDGTGGELTRLGLVHPDTFALKMRDDIDSKEGLNAFGRPIKNTNR